MAFALSIKPFTHQTILYESHWTVHILRDTIRGGLYEGHVSNSGEDRFNHLNTSHMERFGQFFRNKSKTLTATAFFVLQVLPQSKIAYLYNRHPNQTSKFDF